jgi:hypothetical protein
MFSRITQNRPTKKFVFPNVLRKGRKSCILFKHFCCINSPYEDIEKLEFLQVLKNIIFKNFVFTVLYFFSVAEFVEHRNCMSEPNVGGRGVGGIF